MSSTSHHHPPSLIKVQGQCFTPSLPPHTTHQSSTYNSTYYIPVQYTSPVHTTHQSSTYITPVQFNTPSLVHIIHQTSTYIRPPVQYIQHISPVHLYIYTTHACVRLSIGLWRWCDGLSPACPHSELESTAP